MNNEDIPNHPVCAVKSTLLQHTVIVANTDSNFYNNIYRYTWYSSYTYVCLTDRMLANWRDIYIYGHPRLYLKSGSRCIFWMGFEVLSFQSISPFGGMWIVVMPVTHLWPYRFVRFVETSFVLVMHRLLFYSVKVLCWKLNILIMLTPVSPPRNIIIRN